MVTTRSITIDLPNFKTLSDDEVEHHILARNRDGRWSAQTRWLLATFGTDKLELNEAWAENWIDWTCPACRRSKIEIARLTNQGVLLCQLDWHHDHLADYAAKVMKERMYPKLADESQRSAARSIAAALPLIERFAETLLCNDCNAADAAMKAQLGDEVPSFFSFRPSEIGEFVMVEPNRSHGLDVAVGADIWGSVSDDVAARVAFAKMLGARIAAGRHDREKASFALRQSTDDRKLFFALGYEAMTSRNKIEGIADGLVARSRSTAGRWSAPKAKAARKAEAPDRATFATLDASRSAISRLWRDASDGWRCPCCDRNKLEITRKSNKRDWTASIMVVHDFRVETDPASLARRAFHHSGPVVLASHHQIDICQDCRQILSDALTIRPATNAESLSLTQLRGLVEDPQPHARHSVSAATIGVAIDANTDWISGVTDYWAHRQHASDIGFEHYRIIKTTGLTDAGARDLVIPRLVAAGKLPADGATAWFDWWMLEDQRMREASKSADENA